MSSRRAELTRTHDEEETDHVELRSESGQALVERILSAADEFDTSLPCYVTGHSLGAALAVLTPVPVKLLTPNDDVQMYNYAGPRVGDPGFVGAYDQFVPNSFRVVNLADVVPVVAPHGDLSLV